MFTAYHEVLSFNMGFITKCKSILYSNIGLVILVALFIILIATAFLPTERAKIKPIDTIVAEGAGQTITNPLTILGPTMERAEPVRLRIPSLNINTTFEKSLGLNADNTIQVPDSYDEVGWYQYGPTPGELGPAVILGHVDSHQGPAVFFRLGQLSVGDEIIVDRADGTTARFEVITLERHLQSGFPTALVYGDIDHAGLRLITCSGVFVRGQQQYTHNLIVFAKLVE